MKVQKRKNMDRNMCTSQKRRKMMEPLSQNVADDVGNLIVLVTEQMIYEVTIC